MVICPDCKKEISDTYFNVATDVAYCPGCKKNYSYVSLLEEQGGFGSYDYLPELPRSVTVVEDGFSTLLVHRKFAFTGISLILAALFWDSIVSAFLFQLLKSFDWKLALFLIPFILIGIWMPLMALYYMFGKQTIRVCDGLVTFFRGVGAIGFFRTFPLGELQKVVSAKDINSNKNGTTISYSVKATLNNKVHKLSLDSDQAAADYMAAFLRRWKSKYSR